MGFWAAAIRADGLIYGPDFSPMMPDDPSELATIENAKRSLGGENWAAVVLTEEQAQTILGNLPGRCWLIGGEIVPREAPTITLSATVLDVLRPEPITAEINVHATDVDSVSINIVYPSGRVPAEILTLAEGVVTMQIRSSEIGAHRLEVISIETGSASATFEAVEAKPTPFAQAQLDSMTHELLINRKFKTVLDVRAKPLWPIQN
jgi:hypothetical protein